MVVAFAAPTTTRGVLHRATGRALDATNRHGLRHQNIFGAGIFGQRVINGGQTLAVINGGLANANALGVSIGDPHTNKVVEAVNVVCAA